VPSLRQFIYDAAASVPDPNPDSLAHNASLLARWSGSLIKLGAGSDFAAFFNVETIPSIDLGFRPPSGDGQYGDYGVYHSIYDSFHWMEVVGDPTFVYHKACAQLWGIIALRLADAEVLPFNLSSYAVDIQQYVHDVQAVAPANLTFDTFHAAAYSLLASSNRFHQRANSVLAAARAISASSYATALRGVNQRARRFEGQFRLELPSPQSTYHALIAPNPDYSYYAEVFPSLTDGCRDKLSLSDLEVRRDQLVAMLNGAVTFLDAKLLTEGDSPPDNGPNLSLILGVALPLVAALLLGIGCYCWRQRARRGEAYSRAPEDLGLGGGAARTKPTATDYGSSR